MKGSGLEGTAMSTVQRIMPEIDVSRCSLCGDGVPKCAQSAMSLVDGGIDLDNDLCSYCGDCEGICPEDAIALPYDIIIRDKNHVQEK